MNLAEAAQRTIEEKESDQEGHQADQEAINGRDDEQAEEPPFNALAAIEAAYIAAATGLSYAVSAAKRRIIQIRPDVLARHQLLETIYAWRPDIIEALFNNTVGRQLGIINVIAAALATAQEVQTEIKNQEKPHEEQGNLSRLMRDEANPWQEAD